MNLLIFKFALEQGLLHCLVVKFELNRQAFSFSVLVNEGPYRYSIAFL